MSGRSKATDHVRSYFTRVRQLDKSENDVFKCKDCQAILSNDTSKLYSHTLMHYDKLRASIQSHKKETDRNDSQVSASSESTIKTGSPVSVSSCSSSMNEATGIIRPVTHLTATKVSSTSCSLISGFRESGAENTESRSGKAQREKLHSLYAIMMETIESMKEQVNNLNDTTSSIESEMNTPSDRDEQSDEIIVLKHIRKTTSQVAPSNTK